MCEYLKALQKPFPAEDIEWRVSHAVKTQQGFRALVLAYVTNRAIQERLDDVFGIGGWKNEYSEWRGKGVKCTLTCKVNEEWISKEDGADETEMESTKGGFSASMKRAAVQWGIGRYLYNLEQVWVNVKASGQNYINTQVKVGQGKEQCKGYWDTPPLPAWALPENYEPKPIVKADPEGIQDDDTPRPPEPPSDIQNDVVSALDSASRDNTAPSANPAKTPITEGQTKMFWVRAKQAGFETKEEKQIMWELLSAKLARYVWETSHLEKAEFNSILKWFEEKMEEAS